MRLLIAVLTGFFGAHCFPADSRAQVPSPGATPSSSAEGTDNSAVEGKAVIALRAFNGKVKTENGHVVSVSLGGNKMTDAGLVHLKQLTTLEKLHLSDTKITDMGLAHLKGLTNLITLGLSSTQISDAGLEHLSGLTKLQHVSLLQSRVTSEGVKKLKQALPQLDVYYR